MYCQYKSCSSYICCSYRRRCSFETILNAVKNAIFKLEICLEKFITASSPWGENDKGYLTDFSFLRLTSPLMMAVIVAYLLKRNPAGLLWIFLIISQMIPNNDTIGTKRILQQRSCLSSKTSLCTSNYCIIFIKELLCHVINTNEEITYFVNTKQRQLTQQLVRKTEVIQRNSVKNLGCWWCFQRKFTEPWWLGYTIGFPQFRNSIKQYFQGISKVQRK